MAHFISFDQGVYAFSKVDEWYSKPPTVGLSALGIYESDSSANITAVSAVDPKTTQIVLGLISPGRKGTVGGLSTGGKAVSAVGVLFNYTGGQSGINSVSSRCISLSAPHLGGGTNTVIATTISGAFDCSVIYGDRTSIRYAPSAYTVGADTPTAGGLIAPTQPCDMSEPGTTESTDAVGPDIRRLVNMGYL